MPLLRGFILYTHTPSVCQLRLYLFSASVIISVSTFFQLKLAPKFCDVRTFQHTETVDTHTHTPNTKKKKEKKKKMETHTPFALTLNSVSALQGFSSAASYLTVLFFSTFFLLELRPPLIVSHAHLFHVYIIPDCKVEGFLHPRIFYVAFLQRPCSILLNCPHHDSNMRLKPVHMWG